MLISGFERRACFHVQLAFQPGMSTRSGFSIRRPSAWAFTFIDCSHTSKSNVTDGLGLIPAVCLHPAFGFGLFGAMAKDSPNRRETCTSFSAAVHHIALTHTHQKAVFLLLDAMY